MTTQGRNLNLRSLDLLSAPWIHDNDYSPRGLVHSRPPFYGRRRGIYDEHERAMGNETWWNTVWVLVRIDQSPNDATEVVVSPI